MQHDSALPRKRNYVKRKRSLNESTKIIMSTLQSINANSISPLDPNDVTQIALSHAKTIEAACWSRRAKYSDDVFQSIVRTKTLELCRSLIIATTNNNTSTSSALSTSLISNNNGIFTVQQNATSARFNGLTQLLPVSSFITTPNATNLLPISADYNDFPNYDPAQIVESSKNHSNNSDGSVVVNANADSMRELLTNGKINFAQFEKKIQHIVNPPPTSTNKVILPPIMSLMT